MHVDVCMGDCQQTRMQQDYSLVSMDLKIHLQSLNCPLHGLDVVLEL